MPTEPPDNIGVDAAEPFDPDELPTTRAGRVVVRLGELYWQKRYGGMDAFRCLVRTILSQNTADTASERAYDALRDRYDDTTADDARGESLAADLAAADTDELAETITAAGLYTQKARRIVRCASIVREAFGGEAAFAAFVRDENTETVRTRLLEMPGVGPKTADCVSLFAGGHAGVFPVDTHVHRVARRVGLAPPDADHDAVRAALGRDVPPEQCGYGHTTMLQFGRDYCTARSPACLDGLDACPLADLCDRVGVDPETESVIDPADAE